MTITMLNCCLDACSLHVFFALSASCAAHDASTPYKMMWHTVRHTVGCEKEAKQNKIVPKWFRRRGRRTIARRASNNGSGSFVGLVLLAQVAIAVSKPLLIHPPHLRTTIPQHVHVQLPGGYAQEDVVSWAGRDPLAPRQVVRQHRPLIIVDCFEMVDHCSLNHPHLCRWPVGDHIYTWPFVYVAFFTITMEP